MMAWLAANKDALLVLASFLAAASAFFAAWTVAEAQKKNRRALIRERVIADFRVAMTEFLALADRALNRHRQDESEVAQLHRWEDTLAFYKADNAIELLIPFEDESLLEEFRDAIQELKFAYSRSENEFQARSKVVSLSKKIVRDQLVLARAGR